MSLAQALKHARLLLQMDKERSKPYRPCFIYRTAYGYAVERHPEWITEISVDRIVTFVDSTV